MHLDNRAHVLPKRASQVMNDVLKFLVLKPSEYSTNAAELTRVVVSEIETFKNNLPKGNENKAASANDLFVRHYSSTPKTDDNNDDVACEADAGLPPQGFRAWYLSHQHHRARMSASRE